MALTPLFLMVLLSVAVEWEEGLCRCQLCQNRKYEDRWSLQLFYLVFSFFFLYSSHQHSFWCTDILLQIAVEFAVPVVLLYRVNFWNMMDFWKVLHVTSFTTCPAIRLDLVSVITFRRFLLAAIQESFLIRDHLLEKIKCNQIIKVAERSFIF